MQKLKSGFILKSLLQILAVVIAIPALSQSSTETWNDQQFKLDILPHQMNYPWEIAYGPDDSLWITETKGYVITKMHPGNGGYRTLKDLNSFKKYNPATVGIGPQGGLMGMAIHPQLLSGKPYVYVAMVYDYLPNTGTPNNSSCGSGMCYYRTMVLRFTYNTATKSLSNKADTLIANLPGSNDHNSGRLAIGPAPNYYVFYTIGDMGAGQFNNASRTNNAQDTTVYEGKVLRFNSEPDSDADDVTDPYNQWIPNDNPFASPSSGNRLAIYSYGHRNAQGLVWAKVNGVDKLYSSEHGDKSDDEVNDIQMGHNYGWPKVAGMPDNNYSSLDAYANNNKLASKNINYREDTFAVNHDLTRPLFVLFNAAASDIKADGSNIYTWQTVAPSSIDYYGTGTIPGWKNSLLVTSLKYGMYRLKLKTDGEYVDSTITPNLVDTIPYLHGYRMRDLAIAPTGDTLFFIADNTGNTSGPTGGFDGSGSSNTTLGGGKVIRLVYFSTLPKKDPDPFKPFQESFTKIYPNPASSYLNVQTKPGIKKPLLIQLFDMTGKRVMETTTSQDNITLDVTKVAAGMYFLKVTNGYGALVTTDKVVIN